MSLSLTLVFDKYMRAQDPVIASNRLRIDGGEKQLWEVVQPITLPLPHGVEWFDEEVGLKHYTTDKYDVPLTWVPAHLLAPHLRSVAQSDWGRAVAAFVLALPAATRVVLWWH
ncbi:hypothetical protein PAQ31011_05142 [Pandoraea aquatica]|uniref:Uncharacterized protein n=1 Tax=Pandoraea aquatica TaxID=2508290 RepID=A0A5E4Z6L9_9BURK|nr:hypothetical protein [Pandoraea aquatica]VVE56786.1 hypothetical protein PAQ31011_05142 [Pandoraea aquatica]